MTARSSRWSILAAVVTVGVLLAGCTQHDLVRLAGDDKAGRNNGTPGSAAARSFLIGELQPISEGLDPTGTGTEAYTQAIPEGVNVVAVIPGTDLADQYVVVGGHYDGLGSSCTYKSTGDNICNGATDNAAGAVAVLSIARSIARQQTRPRRSVVLAFWDREEDGLIGSRHFVENPLVPLNRVVAYVNFDIQGANLLPNLRNTSFAIASESGGTRFQEIVRAAIGAQTLDTELFSSIFGQNRSDYASFLAAQIPSVFFSDATGPCYHTNDDEPEIVDFGKLDQQIGTALRVTRELANTSTPPAFVSGTPLATFDDALVFARVIELAWVDRGRFSADDQATLQRVRADAQRIVAEGRAAFGSDDVSTTLGNAATIVSMLTRGTCDGFL